MLRQKFAAVVALAFGRRHRSSDERFRVRKGKESENIQGPHREHLDRQTGLTTEGGAKYPFALSPGLFVVNHRKNYFFSEGKKADAALEPQAEDGNPELLSKEYLTKVGGIFHGCFQYTGWCGQGWPDPAGRCV